MPENYLPVEWPTHKNLLNALEKVFGFQSEGKIFDSLEYTDNI